MKRTHLYSFVGTAAAVQLYLTKSGAAAPAAAVAAGLQLQATGQELLEAAEAAPI